VTRTPGGLLVRMFRSAADAGTVTVEHLGAPARGFVVDLRGRPIERFEHALTMRPWQIITLQLA